MVKSLVVEQFLKTYVNFMINLVIVAGGKQTRFKDLSIFPKVLLPTATSCSILKELVDKTKAINIPLKRLLVINKQYAEQVKTYVKVNGLQNDVEIVESTNTNGSFNTLNEVKSKLPNQDVLFIWSDLSLDNFCNVLKKCKECSGNGILFTRDGQYRYGASGYVLDDPEKRWLDNIYHSPSYEGNIPGLYFMKDLSIFDKTDFKEDEIKDLVDAIALNHEDKFELCDLSDIGTELLEYRDLGIYKRYVKDNFKEDKNQTRFFNSLIVDPAGKTITKKAIDSAYVHLVKKEIDWYSKYESLETSENKAVPKVYSFNEDSFVMDYLSSYKPLHCILDDLEKTSDISKIKNVYKNVFKTVEKISRISTIEVSMDVFECDLKKEVIDKVINRCEKIKDFLINYEKDSLEVVLRYAFEHLVAFAKNTSDYDPSRKTMTYWFCHGDLNGSNVMVDETTFDVKFLDPRGYFGNTKLYGWKPYEFAKILYCLYGYDDFNIKPQIYGEDWPKLRTSLEFSEFKEESFVGANYRNYQMLVGIIYVALAGYISQDIMKANIAYDFGMRILKWTLLED